jgi:hypothetical protein
MIVTRELLVHLGACQEAMDWFDTKNLNGLSRLAFIRALKESDSPTDYAAWAASKEGLFSGVAAEFAGTGERRNVWRIIGEGLDPLFEYTAVESDTDALTVMKAVIDEQVEAKIALDAEYFHVYAQQLSPDGGCISAPCDLESDTAPEGCHYATFNMFTGVYEDFDSFLDAKRRCLEIKKLRRDQYASTYHVMQKIEEADSSEGGLSDLLVFTGVTLTAT